MLSAEPLGEAAVSSAMHSLTQGKFKRALQSAVQSDRQHGIVLKMKDYKGRVTEEHSFRVPAEVDRGNLLEILRDPVKAAYSFAPLQPALPTIQLQYRQYRPMKPMMTTVEGACYVLRSKRTQLWSHVATCVVVVNVCRYCK